jgi:hypothetical protein
MMRALILACAAALITATGVAFADDAKPAADAFAGRLFAGAVSPDKNYACFVRRYDSAHLARHPLQKVAAMKLLVDADKDEETKSLNYSFRLGVKFTKRPGDFDSSGSCSKPQGTVVGDSKIKFSCGVDCDGGGISVELNKDNKFTLVRLDSIRIWRNNQPEEDGLDLSGGADDRIFRLDRVKLDQCKSLIADRKELAAIRTLKK